MVEGDVFRKKCMKLYSSAFTGVVWSIVGAVMKNGKY